MALNLPEYCVVFHATAWAGGTITTINPTYTAPEIHHQLIDAGAELLITFAAFADMAKEASKGTKVREITVAFLPFFHIYSLQILMNVNLAAAGRTVTLPRFDLAQFLTLCARYQTPRLWIVPPVALALAKHPIVDTFDLPFIKQINFAAAPLGADIAEAMGKRLGTVVTHGCDMTELSPVSHISRPGLSVAGASGCTIPDTECRIVDPEAKKDLPTGTDGELWVKGKQVKKGYLNNPKATAETIVDGGWLRTGDIANFSADGDLLITDRQKELIKVKGFQVAPAELEALLLTHPNITDAAIIGVPDAECGEAPLAFIVAATPPSLAEVQAFLEPQIAHYKQIGTLQVVPEIPQSASGKILHRVLRERNNAPGIGES